MAHPHLTDGRYNPADLLNALPQDIEWNPEWLTDRDLAAGLWILACFGRDERVWKHVEGAHIDYTRIQSETGFSGPEQALLAAAASIGGWGSADLSDLAVRLDSTRWNALLAAMTIRRGSR